LQKRCIPMSNMLYFGVVTTKLSERRSERPPTWTTTKGIAAMNQYNTRAQFSRRLRHPISQAKRQLILDRDANVCCYCGYEATTVDHIVPYTYGGSDDEDNLVACCSICNSIANNRVFDTISEKRAFVRERYGPYLAGRVRRARKTLSICGDCNDVFDFRAVGASAVLCAECYARDEEGLPRKERVVYDFRLERKIEDERAAYNANVPQVI
jgi:hypothetical protein